MSSKRQIQISSKPQTPNVQKCQLLSPQCIQLPQRLSPRTPQSPSRTVHHFISLPLAHQRWRGRLLGPTLPRQRWRVVGKKAKLVSSSHGAMVNRERDFEIRETFHPWRVRRKRVREQREKGFCLLNVLKKKRLE